MSEKVCSKCGTIIPEGDQFCPNCGQSITLFNGVIDNNLEVKKEPRTPLTKKQKILLISLATLIGLSVITPFAVKGITKAVELNKMFKIEDGVLVHFNEKIAIKYEVYDIKVPNSVTSIGNSAFRNCRSLKTVAFEENSQLTSIGEDAFYNCESLKTVTFGENSQLKNIGGYAFSDCSSLKSIAIPNSVTSIGNSAFFDCNSLENIYYKGTIEDWCNIEFTDIESNPMYNAEHFYMLDENNEWHELTDIIIPNTVTSIGWHAFSGCSSLKTVTFEENSQLKNIGGYAFSNCSSLKSIVIPNSVTSIGWHAFSGCSSLESIVIPNSVTSIGERVFYGCSSLESITLPFVGQYADGSGNTHFGYIFGAYNSVINNEYVPSSLKEVIITGGTTIGEHAFSNCSSLESIVITNSVTSIGKYAFEHCTSLESIVIPNSVTSIGLFAFINCSSLESIVIPNSVTSIEQYAFYNCNSLTIYCEAEHRPGGWDGNWNYPSRPVYWAGQWEYDAFGNPVPII